MGLRVTWVFVTGSRNPVKHAKTSSKQCDVCMLVKE